MLIPFGVFSAAGAGGGASAGSYELISTTILGSNTNTVSFSSIVSTYKHLQIRVASRGSGSNSDLWSMRINSDTGSNYAFHRLRGTGSAVASAASTTQTRIGYLAQPYSSDTSGNFSPAIIDILDYAGSKNKTVRLFSGADSVGGSHITLGSGLWASTSAVTSISLYTDSESFLTGSRFSLYGVKG